MVRCKGKANYGQTGYDPNPKVTKELSVFFSYDPTLRKVPKFENGCVDKEQDQ
jgi:hypothetical protein